MSLGALVASAVGYLWLLITILSTMGVFDFPTATTPAWLFPSFALILVGRALRKRAAAQVEQETVFEVPPPPELTPPIPPDVAKPAPAESAMPPPAVQPRPNPSPRAAEPPPAAESIAEPAPEPAQVNRPAQVPTGHKTSRELVDEARARWGKKP